MRFNLKILNMGLAHDKGIYIYIYIYIYIFFKFSLFRLIFTAQMC